MRFVSVCAGFLFVSCGFGSSVPGLAVFGARRDTDGTKPCDTKENVARTDTDRKITPNIVTRTETEHL